MDRRQFIAGAALAATQAGLSGEVLAQATMQKELPTMGIQIGTISFQDEGPEKVLDILATRTSITSFLAPSISPLSMTINPLLAPYQQRWRIYNRRLVVSLTKK